MTYNKLTLLALLAVMAISGCAKPPDNSAAGGGPSADAGSRPSTPDPRIAQAVKDKFAADSELKGEKIGVEVKDGRVMLTGTVSSDLKRIRAEDTARAVDDVFGVDAEKLVVK